MTVASRKTINFARNARMQLKTILPNIFVPPSVFFSILLNSYFKNILLPLSAFDKEYKSSLTRRTK